MFPSLSVIVVGYNSREHLDRCLDSLSMQVYPGELEVLFVDNASSDGSVEHVRSRFPDVRIIETGGNLGYAGGNNVGALHARNDILAFLNPDTSASADALAELVRPLLRDPSIGLTTAKLVLMDDPQIINTCGNEISLTGVTTCRRMGEPASTLLQDEEVNAVSGAAFATPAMVFHQLGGFDERFWMYLEDTDLSWRARLAGYRCVVASRSVIAHVYSLKISAAKACGIERNRYLMLGKNLSWRAFFALLPLLLLGEVCTWGWAVKSGPRFAWSKLRALAWTLGNLALIVGARSSVQRLRRVTDGHLLREHIVFPQIEGIAAGLVGKVSAALIVPVAVAVATVGLALVGSGATVVPGGGLDESGLSEATAGGD